MLNVLSLIARVRLLDNTAAPLASLLAKLNLAMGNYKKLSTPKEMAYRWKEFMPNDRQNLYEVEIGKGDENPLML